MRIYLYLSVFVLNVFCATAQPGAIDLSFKPNSAVDSTIWCTKVLANGKILVGGNFTEYDGAPVYRLARLHPDGKLDTSFNTGAGFDNIVFCVEEQTDGKLLVGGYFFSYDNLPLKHFVRLNSNGSLDTTFVNGAAGQQVKAIAIQPDGRIIIGGNFISYLGDTATRVIRLNPDGTRDYSFKTNGGFNGSVETIALQPDSNVVLGGSFGVYYSNINLRIVRLLPDGTLDNTFNPGIGGAGANVTDIDLRPDGKLLLGGRFTNYNGTACGYFQRTDPDGAIDFSMYQGPGANMSVNSVKIIEDYDMVLAGNFTTFHGVPTGRVARLRSNGYLDTLFSIAGTADGEVFSISQQADGKLIVAGDFETYNQLPFRKIVRLYNCLTTQPDTIFGLDYADCKGTLQTYHVPPVADAVKYEWVLPSGWAGNSDSTSITAVSDGSGGPLSVRVFSDSCGWSFYTTRIIQTLQPPGVDICLVTVDTNSTHNIVIWEKPVTGLIDSFFIYREISSNNYAKIGAVAYEDAGQFNDYGANPNATSYRYKLSVIDTCGAESALSPYHSTIHLQNLGNGNFQWTFYSIQGQTNPVVSFNMYREPAVGAGFFPIGNIPGTNSTFTDLTFNAFTDSRYVVDVNWNIGCDPFRQVNTTRSNIRPRSTIDVQWPPVGIEDNMLQQIHIYPNPASGILHFSIPAPLTVINVRIINTVGQVVQLDNGHTDRITVEDLPTGLYVVQLETNYGTLQRLFSVQ